MKEWFWGEWVDGGLAMSGFCKKAEVRWQRPNRRYGPETDITELVRQEWLS
jgi:hypothetical protein